MFEKVDDGLIKFFSKCQISMCCPSTTQKETARAAMYLRAVEHILWVEFKRQLDDVKWGLTAMQ